MDDDLLFFLSMRGFSESADMSYRCGPVIGYLLSSCSGAIVRLRKAHWYGEFIRRFPEAGRIIRNSCTKNTLRTAADCRRSIANSCLFGYLFLDIDADCTLAKMVEFNGSPKKLDIPRSQRSCFSHRKAIAARSTLRAQKIYVQGRVLCVAIYKEGGKNPIVFFSILAIL